MKAVKQHLIRVSIVTALSLGLFACGGGDHLASVDGEKITQQEFNAYLKLKRIDEKNAERTKAALDNYIERKALAAAIESQESLDAQAIAAELEDFRMQMLLSRYFESYLNNQVTDSAIDNFYRENSERWTKKKVKVAHILIRTRPDLPETELQTKLTLAREAWSQLQAGKSFDEVAKKYSEDDLSAKKGGDLGWITEGAVDATFSSTAFGMQQDAVSEPVKTHYGFHIIKVLEGPATVTEPLESVKGDIRYELRNMAKEAELKRLLASVDVERNQ
ncbi:peptidylprolyl isomerase [Permianibacter aggregans]|uniref:peptidylprolyl isomerase n=1 Tax=Permianibacter aggregans TaxID=1510150 RepID=A0A4R6UGG4_9GAMM|nr:peptidylprolyl isomerase [Permianibacter aggregans]QGX39809.1 peptidylprolyl isomerase [Permianibacter aggregans]TDQ45901.1 peptidyl-prolyl cis-trans isomerase C [Permianibacter aggregans]